MLRRESPVTAFFATILLLVAVGMVAGLGGIYYTFEISRRMTGLQANSAILANQGAASLELAAWNFDDAQLRKLIAAIMQVQNVDAVKLQVKDVSSPGGVKRLGLVRDAQWHPAVMDTDFPGAGAGILEFERPIVSPEGEALGSVKLYVTPKFMEADLRQRLIDLVVAFIVLAMILTASLYVLMWRAVLRPLQMIERYAAQVSSGGTASMANQRKFRGELERLRLSIEKMVDLLAVRYASLQRHQTMLFGVLNSTPQSIFWKDLDSRYLGCNETFARLAGLSHPNQIVGKTDFDLQLGPWRLPKSIAPNDREIMTTGIARRRIIEPLATADGIHIAVETTKLPLLDSSGKVYGMLGVFEDITTRVEVERRNASQLMFEEMVARISSMLVAAEPQNLDEILRRALQDMARLLNAHRMVLGQTDEHTGEMVARAHYRETEPPFPPPRVISERYPRLWSDLRQGRTSHIPDVAALPPDHPVDRQNFEEVGIHSQVTAPVLIEGRLRFILAVASVGRKVDWSEEAVAQIKFLAELLAITTLRCEAEDVLRTSERQFRTFIEQAPVPIILVPSPDGSPIYFNPAFTRVFGYAHDDIKQPEDWWPLVYPDPDYRSARYADWQKTMAQLQDTGEFHDAEEAEMRTRTGDIRFAESRRSIVGNYRMTFLNDLTDRRRAETVARLTQYAVDHTPIMIFRIDMQAKFVYANDAACARFGYSPAEILHLHLWNISRTSTSENWPERSKTVSEQGSTAFETVFLTRSGATFPVQVQVQYIEFSGEKYFFTYAEDITDRKAAEQAEHAYTRRIQKLATELTRAEERQRRELATILHDDVGQNLFAVTTQLLTMQTHTDQERIEIQKALALLDQVTRDTRELTFELCPPVLYQLGLMPALQRLADQLTARHGVACKLIGHTAGPVDLNARGLAYQAVRELLNNVAKHAQAKNVAITAAEVNGQVHIDVADDGVGFDCTRLQSGSVGFGLFHLRERIELLGGAYSIDSSPGHGCRVQLRLPLNVLQPLE